MTVYPIPPSDWIFRRISSIKKGTDVLGNRTRVKVVKNKLAPPFRQVESDIMYGEGISAGELVDLGLDAGCPSPGAWYSYGEERIGQGRDNAKKFLLANPEIFAELDQRLRIHHGLIDNPEENESN